MTELNHLNTLGRTKLAELRKDIESLDQLAKDNCDVKLMSEAESHRLQLSRLDCLIFTVLIYLIFNLFLNVRII